MPRSNEEKKAVEIRALTEVRNLRDNLATYVEMDT